ncbi:hypothetical protein [Amycolatopsis aidingensis]|uniref:hypothetical protein n=1 Tax=Amycolatopsis aidingensis TaxID=2842453 RepID=UPI001C0C8004|nr:hypothetical protein [Amycolatopsis aidingensis]
MDHLDAVGFGGPEFLRELSSEVVDPLWVVIDNGKGDSEHLVNDTGEVAEATTENDVDPWSESRVASAARGSAAVLAPRLIARDNGSEQHGESVLAIADTLGAQICASGRCS